MNYELESELFGRNTHRRFLSEISVSSLFSFNSKDLRENEARTERKKENRREIAFFVSMYIAYIIHPIITQRALDVQCTDIVRTLYAPHVQCTYIVRPVPAGKKPIIISLFSRYAL